MAYVSTTNSLPRTLDVVVNLSRPTTELRTNLTIPCFVSEFTQFLPDARRVRFYSTMEALENDFAAGTDVHFAASAFFAQSPRATTMAVGGAFFTAQKAEISTPTFSDADIATIALISNGSMDVGFNDDAGSSISVQSFTGMDFTGVTTLAGVAEVINAKAGSDLTCTVRTLRGGDKVLSLQTVATGDNVTIYFPIAGAGGTFAGAALKMTEAAGATVLNGYTPTGLADELTSIQNAAGAAGKYIYGWALGSSLGDYNHHVTAAGWIASRTGVFALTCRDPLALNSSYGYDIGHFLTAHTANKRVVALYHNNTQEYPDMSLLAYMLSVDYYAPNSAVTAKFKALSGCATVPLTETEWGILQAKGYNCYTLVGNAARTLRDGASGDSNWFLDSVINLDNFVEDLSVNVFNVFLRNGKVPYTKAGQMLLADACHDTGEQYVYNGVFAPREVASSSAKSGTTIVPAYQVIPTPISAMSVSQRAARVGPPIEMVVQEAGAIHSVSVNVEVIS